MEVHFIYLIKKKQKEMFNVNEIGNVHLLHVMSCDSWDNFKINSTWIERVFIRYEALSNECCGGGGRWIGSMKSTLQ